ncbi:MAG: class I SAM-dependent methyltransferase [Micromonosporaceae bacterium]
MQEGSVVADDHPGRHSAARTAVVWDALRGAAAARVRQTGHEQLDIVDAGGGTGGFAVPLACLGHRVTVVDPSPDSLAAAQRRAAENSVTLVAVQGDVTDLQAIVGEASADLVLCHSVLEYVDDPAAAMATIARVMRPGAVVSVLAAGALAAAIHRALAGRFGDARAILTGAGTAVDLSAPPRRFTMSTLTALIEKAGLRPGAAHGIKVFADLVPSALADAEPGAAEALLALEQAAAEHPALRDIATQLHVLGYR